MPRTARILARTCVLIATFLASALPGAAAEDDAPSPIAASSLRTGSWSLQFEVVDNFRLGAFEGSALSVKRHWSPKTAWRAGVSYGIRLGDFDEALATFNDSTVTGIPGRDRDQSSVSLGFSLLFLHYPAPGGRVNTFVGAGPFVSGSRHSLADRTETSPATLWEMSSRSFAAGLTGVAGAEVFVAPRLSLLGQYSTSLAYEQSRNASEVVSPGPGAGTIVGIRSSTDSRAWRLSPGSVRLGLSAYL